jgi:type I restriction enzyme, R subunit
LPSERKTGEGLDHAIRQMISEEIVYDEIVNVLAAAGIRMPDISILSDEFLAQVRGMRMGSILFFTIP